jgi:hypothetical protein
MTKLTIFVILAMSLLCTLSNAAITIDLSTQTPLYGQAVTVGFTDTNPLDAGLYTFAPTASGNSGTLSTWFVKSTDAFLNPPAWSLFYSDTYADQNACYYDGKIVGGVDFSSNSHLRLVLFSQINSNNKINCPVRILPKAPYNPLSTIPMTLSDVKYSTVSINSSTAVPLAEEIIILASQFQSSPSNSPSFSGKWDGSKPSKPLSPSYINLTFKNLPANTMIPINVEARLVGVVLPGSMDLSSMGQMISMPLMFGFMPGNACNGGDVPNAARFVSSWPTNYGGTFQPYILTSSNTPTEITCKVPIMRGFFNFFGAMIAATKSAYMDNISIETKLTFGSYGETTVDLGKMEQSEFILDAAMGGNSPMFTFVSIGFKNGVNFSIDQIIGKQDMFKDSDTIFVSTGTSLNVIDDANSGNLEPPQDTSVEMREQFFGDFFGISGVQTLDLNKKSHKLKHKYALGSLVSALKGPIPQTRFDYTLGTLKRSVNLHSSVSPQTSNQLTFNPSDDTFSFSIPIQVDDSNATGDIPVDVKFVLRSVHEFRPKDKLDWVCSTDGAKLTTELGVQADPSAYFDLPGSKYVHITGFTTSAGFTLDCKVAVDPSAFVNDVQLDLFSIFGSWNTRGTPYSAHVQIGQFSFPSFVLFRLSADEKAKLIAKFPTIIRSFAAPAYIQMIMPAINNESDFNTNVQLALNAINANKGTFEPIKMSDLRFCSAYHSQYVLSYIAPGLGMDESSGRYGYTRSDASLQAFAIRADIVPADQMADWIDTFTQQVILTDKVLVKIVDSSQNRPNGFIFTAFDVPVRYLSNLDPVSPTEMTIQDRKPSDIEMLNAMGFFPLGASCYTSDQCYSTSSAMESPNNAYCYKGKCTPKGAIESEGLLHLGVVEGNQQLGSLGYTTYSGLGSNSAAGMGIFGAFVLLSLAIFAVVV